MVKFSFDVMAAVGFVLGILLVVLDKAGKLKGPMLFVLLGVAAAIMLPFAIGNSWVANATPGMLKFSRGMLMVSLVAVFYSLFAIWISPSGAPPVKDLSEDQPKKEKVQQASSYSENEKHPNEITKSPQVSLRAKALQLSKEISKFVEMRSQNRPVLHVPVMPTPEQQHEMYEHEMQRHQEVTAQFNSDVRTYYSEHFADRVTEITLELKAKGVYPNSNGEDVCHDPLLIEVYKLCAEKIKEAALKLPSTHSEEIPLSNPIIEYQVVADHTEACLVVKNSGTIADVWASLRIVGFVSGKRDGIFGRWTHTNSSKARIAKGQSCKLLLATRKSDSNFVTVKWSIPYTEEQGIGGVTESFYSSMIGNKDARADDIHIYAHLFADPDCVQETKECHVVLHALESENLSS